MTTPAVFATESDKSRLPRVGVQLGGMKYKRDERMRYRERTDAPREMRESRDCV